VAKQHEIEYAERMDHRYESSKPFLDADRGRNLIRVGTLFTLLPPPPARILDLGCGTGWTSRFFARAGYDVVGVDIAPEMIRLANKQKEAEGLTNISFLVSDYETLTFRDEFDAVVFFDSLHHAEKEQLAVQRAFAALKPGGMCLAVEPGYGHHDSDVARTAVAAHGVTEKDMPPEYVVQLGRAAGFSGFRVFPLLDELGRAIHAERQPVADPFLSDGAVAGQGPSRSLWSKLRWRLWLAFSSSGQWRRTVDHLFYASRWYGMVLLHKGHAAEQRAAA
jgi:SAM-dependent methyltransferase